jgi:hypothetical protein
MRIVIAMMAVSTSLSIAFAGVGYADPAPPTPGPTATSTDDELVDMVLEAIAHGAPAPSTSPDTAPPN